MIKNILLGITLFCATLQGQPLQGQPEYDIYLLAPQGEELITRTPWREGKAVMNDSGYIGGGFSFLGNKYAIKPYLYHPDLGFRLIALPNQGMRGWVDAINMQGIAVGVYGKHADDDPFYEHPLNIFIYDSEHDTCYDLFDFLDIKDRKKMLHDDFSYSSHLTSHISNSNQVIVTHKNYYEEITETFIFDLTKKGVFTKLEGFISANQTGQMIGLRLSEEDSYYDDDDDDDYEYFEDCDAHSSWFFDPISGVQELGSLDIFSRWKVVPKVLSPNGVIGGLGFDSYHEMKGFIWSQSQGLIQFDLMKAPISLTAINDKGHLIGNYESEDDDDDYGLHAFLFTDEGGLITLGPFGGGVSIASSINNQTQIVGAAEIQRAATRAYIWDPSQGMRDLTSLIPQNTGWKVLERATHINDSGYITGYGNYYGVSQTFVLVPRTPANAKASEE